MSLHSHDYKTNPFEATFDVVKSTTLQMSDFANGNNKYYQLELHKDSKGRFRLYSRYGRTGKKGVEEERIPADESSALREFDRICKSKNAKGYVEVKMVSTAIGSDEGNKKIQSDDFKKTNVTTATPTSNIKLDPVVAMLVQRLYDEAGQTCQTSLNGSLQTSAKNPLGTLTLSQINDGLAILQEMNKLLAKHPGLIDSIDDDVVELSNKFYSAIPHEIPLRPRDAEGRKVWMKQFLLNNAKILDEKKDLLDLLGDVKGMMEGFGTSDISVKYNEINCSIDPVDSASPTFDRIKKFVEGTQSNHHHWRLKVRRVFKVASKAQSGYDTVMSGIGNVQPLFHGSRAANIMGICKKGLLLRPPGAYVTGSMFGNGLYFADQSTKSSQYATARFGGSSGRGDTFFMFVADVALGKIRQYEDSQSHLVKAPAGYHSVQGVKGRSLIHNEFIIYDVRQNQLQYLVEFEQK